MMLFKQHISWMTNNADRRTNKKCNTVSTWVKYVIHSSFNERFMCVHRKCLPVLTNITLGVVYDTWSILWEAHVCTQKMSHSIYQHPLECSF